jgi:hypothetical protein
MLTYDEARDLFATARDSYAGKPLANNTRLHERPTSNGTAYAVTLHGTDVVTMHADGTYELNAGGWTTVTTKDRINGWSPARVYSDRGTWYVELAPNPADPEPNYPMSGQRQVGEQVYTDWQGVERSYPIYERIPLTRAQRAERKSWREWRDRNRTPFYDGIVVDADGFPKPRDLPREWCKQHGLRVRNGCVTLWKAVDSNFTSNHGAVYRPRTTVTASDYRPTLDCGQGLHFGPTPDVALRYHHAVNGTVVLKCRVPLDSLIPLGDKCKAKSCYVIGRVAT